MHRRASVDGSVGGFAQNEFGEQPFQFPYSTSHEQTGYVQEQGSYQGGKGPSPPLMSPSGSLGYALHTPTSEVRRVCLSDSSERLT